MSEKPAQSSDNGKPSQTVPKLHKIELSFDDETLKAIRAYRNLRGFSEGCCAGPELPELIAYAIVAAIDTGKESLSMTKRK